MQKSFAVFGKFPYICTCIQGFGKILKCFS